MNRSALCRSKLRIGLDRPVSNNTCYSCYGLLATFKRKYLKMNTSWQEFLSASGARIDNGLAADFGDLGAELLAARDSTVISPLTHLGLIECTGDDAKSFLHNQLTSDVNHLAANAAQHSSWCTAKGRMLASFIFYRSGADYRALLSADLLAATQKRLQIYVLRSKVKLADLTTSHEVIGLSGPQATAALAQAALPNPEKPMDTQAFANGSVIRLDENRLIIVVAATAAAALWQSLASSARPVGTSAWQWLDIHAGIPLITEATKEAFVPQMANFDIIGGVSFHKGCYPGQEVVARAHYLGKIKRHLYRFHSDVAMQAGDNLCSAENPEAVCGTIANAAPSPAGGYDALGVVQESFAEAGELRLGTPQGPALKIEAV